MALLQRHLETSDYTNMEHFGIRRAGKSRSLFQE